MATTSKLKTDQSEAVPHQEVGCPTFELFLAEVKQLLQERGLKPSWIEELIEGDRHYLERAFAEKKLPVYAAFEVYITEDESASGHKVEDRRLKLDVSEQAMKYLQQLVEIGLWGGSVEGVANTLIQQQLASKLEAGLFRQSAHR